MYCLTKWFVRLRNRAVEDYKRCILGCLQPSSACVSLLDCGCDDAEWTLKLGERIGNACLFGIEIVENRRRLATEKGIDARGGILINAFHSLIRSLMSSMPIKSLNTWLIPITSSKKSGECLNLGDTL